MLGSAAFFPHASINSMADRVPECPCEGKGKSRREKRGGKKAEKKKKHKEKEESENKKVYVIEVTENTHTPRSPLSDLTSPFVLWPGHNKVSMCS